MLIDSTPQGPLFESSDLYRSTPLSPAFCQNRSFMQNEFGKKAVPYHAKSTWPQRSSTSSSSL